VVKVVYLNPSGQLGGAERSLLDVLACIRASKPSWSLYLLTSADGPLVGRAVALGVHATVLPFPRALERLGDAGVGGSAGETVGWWTLVSRMLAASWAVPAYVRRLHTTLRAFGPDVIHTNGFKMHVLGVWARPHGVPVLWHVHDYVSSRPVMATLLGRHVSSCAGVVANSDSVAADVRRVCGDRVDVRRVYNAVDLARFAPIGATIDLDERAGLSRAPFGTVRVGLVATTARWKGHEVFLRAIARLPGDLPVRGYIISGSIYETLGTQYRLHELRQLAVNLGLQGKIGFTGFVDEPALAMRALDIVVHASTMPEPFGLVIAEAMACGRALVVSNTGGAAEIVAPERNALTHSPGDSAALADCIIRLARDPALRVALASEARATAERDFDSARLVSDFLPVYEAITSRFT
jgi:glycosyltransferase involved in cell wall biosynthesis